MFTTIRRLRLEPLTYVLCFSLWAMVCGLSLAFPGEGHNYNPSWASLQAFTVSDSVWSALMITDSILLFLTVRITDLAYRAAICIVSGVTWGLLGVSGVVTSLMQFGHLSAVGMFSTVGAILCFVVAEKWVHYHEH